MGVSKWIFSLVLIMMAMPLKAHAQSCSYNLNTTLIPVNTPASPNVNLTACKTQLGETVSSVYYYETFPAPCRPATTTAVSGTLHFGAATYSVSGTLSLSAGQNASGRCYYNVVGENFNLSSVSVPTPAYLITPWAPLTSELSSCSSASPGAPCETAVNRYCSTHGYGAGFGLEEYVPTAAGFSCLPTNAEVTTNPTFTSLSATGAPCSVSEVGASCLSASYRYCQKAGYASGFGPVEYAGNNTAVVCTNPDYSTPILTTFTALAEATPATPGCVSNAPFSNACKSAIHRYCNDSGYAGGGFGPNEYNGNSVIVTCVR